MHRVCRTLPSYKTMSSLRWSPMPFLWPYSHAPQHRSNHDVMTSLTCCISSMQYLQAGQRCLVGGYLALHCQVLDKRLHTPLRSTVAQCSATPASVVATPLAIQVQHPPPCDPLVISGVVSLLHAEQAWLHHCRTLASVAETSRPPPYLFPEVVGHRYAQNRPRQQNRGGV